MSSARWAMRRLRRSRKICWHETKHDFARVKLLQVLHLRSIIVSMDCAYAPSLALKTRSSRRTGTTSETCIPFKSALVTH